MGLTKAELIETAAIVYERMVAGDSDRTIKEDYELDDETFNAARRYMLESRAAEAREKPREHVFVEYCIEQQKTIAEIDTFLKKLDDSKQYNAVVGALRLRSDVVDKMVTRGMEFGLIRREPERKEIVAGVAVMDLSEGDLKKAITGQIGKLNDLVQRFGEGDMGSLSVGALHYGDAVEVKGEEVAPKELPPRAEGKARAKTSKRSSGRKRVRR